MNNIPLPEAQNLVTYERNVTGRESSVPQRRDQQDYPFPDELLLRHARAASVELGPSSNNCDSIPTRHNHQPDFNNNYLMRQPRDENHSTNLTTTPYQNQPDPEATTNTNATQETRLRHQLDTCQRSFREERRHLLSRIHELENDLDCLNAQRLEENDRHSEHLKQADDQAQRVSEELTRALLKNVVLADENAAMKGNQQGLSLRMTSLEEQLQRLDAPNQENIKTVLRRLEKRELGLKNQAKRLAQLESYYTRELNLLALSGGRGPIPELQTEESSLFQIHPQPPPSSLAHPRQQPTVKTYGLPGIDTCLPPMTIINQKPKLTHEGLTGKSSYSELYYKTITDKAINLIQRESGTCNTLLQKFGKPSPPNRSQAANIKQMAVPNFYSTDISSSELEFEQVTKTKSQPTKSPLSRTSCNEEEEMLKLLFFKF